jgi:Protein of unknown function (DUF3667)
MISLEKGLLNGTHCPNCGTEQYDRSSHCHKCGQKHLDIRKSAWSFFKDFLDTNFNFDSKVFKTGLFLIIRPGYLTKAFIEGKRTAFLPPIRLYVFFSVFFFAGLVGSISMDKAGKIYHKRKEKIEKAMYTDTLYQKLMLQKIDQNEKIKIDCVFSKDLTFLKKIRTDSSNIVSLGGKSKQNLKVSDIDIYTLETDELIKKYNIQKTLQKTLVEQGHKIFKDTKGFVIDFIGSKLWWATLLMIPFMALMLKILYVRRKRYYSEHLIYGFHFFSITLLLGIPIFYIKDENVQGIYFGVYFLVTIIYQIISQKVVYEQGWIKTTIKALLLQFLTFIGFIFFMIAAAIVGVLMLK